MVAKLEVLADLSTDRGHEYDALCHVRRGEQKSAESHDGLGGPQHVHAAHQS